MPVSWPLGGAIFLTIWFTVLFAVLPFGVRSQHEVETQEADAPGGEAMVPGTDPGAPVAPRLVMKAIWTSIVSLVVFAAFLAYLRILA